MRKEALVSAICYHCIGKRPNHHKTTSAVTHGDRSTASIYLPNTGHREGVGKAMKEAGVKAAIRVGFFLLNKKIPPPSHPIRNSRTLGSMDEGLQNSVVVTNDILT